MRVSTGGAGNVLLEVLGIATQWFKRNGPDYLLTMGSILQVHVRPMVVTVTCDI